MIILVEEMPDKVVTDKTDWEKVGALFLVSSYLIAKIVVLIYTLAKKQQKTEENYYDAIGEICESFFIIMSLVFVSYEKFPLGFVMMMLAMMSRVGLGYLITLM